MGSGLIPRVLQLAERSGFLLASTGVTSSLQFGPAGQLLKNNVSYEWFQSNVVDTQDNVFPVDQQFLEPDDWEGFKSAFNYAIQLTGSKLPFGLAEIRPSVIPSNILQPPNGELSVLTPHKATIARTRKFDKPGSSEKLFDYWQRQRKIWWRKFSNSPGRISIENTEPGCIGIVMNLPELPPLTVETICQLGIKPFEEIPKDSLKYFEVKDGRKLVLPHVVESCVSIETAVLAFLCDALEQRESDQIVLTLHRKLAPYKVAFVAAPSATSTVGQDIADLALFLARVLRRAGISVMLLPDLGKKSLESQLVRYDELGVPYCVVLTEGALKNGVIGLRNRDTTLKEQVHVAELKSYVKILMKNY